MSSAQPSRLVATGGRLRYACAAGTCAALGSFFGKLTATEARSTLFAGTALESLLGTAGWIPLGLFVICMLLSNAMVWTFFVRALHSAGGSLVATVTSAATNYAISAALGCLLFGETTTLLWWSGTGCVLAGLVLIGTDESIGGREEDGIGGNKEAKRK